ncbi:MAG: LiaI-LiaF-like domain-containing protein [Telluria sp.]
MKNNMTGKNLSSQVVMGAVAIGLGLLFLLDNLNILDFHNVVHFWPVVFIAIGVVKLWDSRNMSGYLVGGAFITVGVLMTLHRMGYIYFSMRTMWPLILIGMGGFVIAKALARRKDGVPLPAAGEGDDSVVDITAIMGGFERRIVTQDFRGGEITAVMGGCDLDMRDSSINGEAVINVFAVFGGISIKVPRDWTVILHGTPIMGGFDEKTNNPADSTKRLIVKGHAIMGGVEVRN